jgi:uncharacterized membrane protein
MSKPLPKDLQELLNANVITADVAGDIQNYYQNKKNLPSEKFNGVLGILGALLVGSGIVLLVAHNWDEMTRSLQTVFAFLPMVLGQGLCIFTLLRKRINTAWRESSSVILFFGVASCIALVSQMYHISGSLPDFILRWLLLTAPLVYIMKSSLSSLLVIAGATWYVLLVGYNDIFSSRQPDIPYYYFLFLLFIVPHYYKYLKTNRESNFFHLHNWSLVVSTTMALGAFAGKTDDVFQWIFIGYCALFSIFYLLGESIYFTENRLFANPFLIAGVLGTVTIFLFWSYDNLWNELTETGSIELTNISKSFFIYLSIILLAVHVYLLVKSKKRHGIVNDPVALSLYVFALAVLAFSNLSSIGLLLINVWILIMGMYYIRKGTARDHLGILNFGLVIIAALALFRFFDDSIPFIWRGLFFVATGIGFFIANYLLLKKRKSLS